MSSFHIVALVIYILVSLNFLWYLALYFPFFFLSDFSVSYCFSKNGGEKKQILYPYSHGQNEVRYRIVISTHGFS